MVKKRKNVAISISQIFILVVSLFAFSYFIGSEFRIVSAADDMCSVDKKGNFIQIGDQTGTRPAEVGELTQSVINDYCIKNGGSTVCYGGSGAWTLGQTFCPGEISKVPSSLPLPGATIPGIKNGPSSAPTSSTPAELSAAAATETKKLALKNNEKALALGIVKNAAIAAALYTGVRFGLSQIGASPEFTGAASKAAAIGYFAATTTKSIAGFFGLKVGALTTGLIGLGVAIIIFALTFKQTKYRQVTFTCYPWDAPTGGKDCEKCNTDVGGGGLPCTEYQCRSLGQACELVNQGTTEELCVWKSRGDVKPPVIQPWEKAISLGYKYIPDNTISPPDRGVKLVPQSNNSGCVAPFSNISFGVTLDEPAKCKVDPVNKGSLEEMDFFFGGSSTSKYNHTQIMRLPSPQSLAAENITIANGGRFAMYVRCEDSNGNANTANFVFNFCVNEGPDTTPPLIVSTSILNNMPIAFNQTSVALQVYVNEPSECKWSKVDQNYADMENQMTCSTGVFEVNAQGLYQCATTLTGLRDRVDNDFYFRCKDQPHFSLTANESQRNVNSQSYKFTLKGTEPLVLNDVKPNGTTIKDSTDVIKVTLNATTSAGYSEGRAICYFSDTGADDSYVEFFETDSHEHSQDLFLAAGSYNYHVRCVDLGGNIDSAVVDFKVETDTQAPSVVRVFRQENFLKVITNEESQCVYGNFGCDYLFVDGTNMSKAINGTEHSTTWNTDKVFYIKCADKFGNQPFPNQCNIIAKPFEIK